MNKYFTTGFLGSPTIAGHAQHWILVLNSHN